VTGDGNIPPLRFSLYGTDKGFVLNGGQFKTIFYRVEQSRGYECRGQLWCPGYLRTTLHPEQTFTVVVSTEPWERILAQQPDEAFRNEQKRRRKLFEASAPVSRSGWAAELVLAADQFIITPSTRGGCCTSAGGGDDVRTVIAGYHWFTDWGGIDDQS
jgi:hypothetical protein